MKTSIIERHPLWLRISHWINVPVLAFLVWSGILIYWADDWVPGFFPEWFYNLFHLDSRLALGMSVHFTMAWLFVGNGVLYLAFAVFGHWRAVVPGPADARGLLPTLRAELAGGVPLEPGRYNPAQKFAYASVIALAALEVASGFAIYKPVQLGWLRWCLGGYRNARLIHFLGMVALVAFTFVHVAQVVRAGWANFRSMVAGFEREPAPPRTGKALKGAHGKI